MRSILLSLCLFLIPVTVFSQMGPSVSKTKDGQSLKWENQKIDYFVMFKSLLANNVRTFCSPSSPEPYGCDIPGNPQADVCLEYEAGSTFALESKHVPDDAFVEAAFLVWTSNINPEDFEGDLDNSVTLSFVRNNSTFSLSREIKSHVEGSLNVAPDFHFEWSEIKIPNDEGKYGAFTYRVDVTDFMQEIIKDGQKEGLEKTGETLLGDYNVKNLECSSEHALYVNRSLLVKDWFLVLIYSSEKVSNKNLYVYNGFKSYSHTNEDINVDQFDLPEDEEVNMKLTIVTHEGDNGLFGNNPGNPLGTTFPEAFFIMANSSRLFLTNECNPTAEASLSGGTITYTEVFNGVSSVYLWDDTWESDPVCIGGDPSDPDPDEVEYGIDVDTFIVNSKMDAFKDFFKSNPTISFKLSANQDMYWTNLFVIAVDVKEEEPDIEENDTNTNTDTDTDESDKDSTQEDSDNDTPEDKESDSDSQENDDQSESHNDSSSDPVKKGSKGCSISVL